ncbi:MAG: histidinol-phosphate transaminase [Bacillota bacterium]|nr:histidinol-phosphate transaminase [Bacillota bacterium]
MTIVRHRKTLDHISSYVPAKSLQQIENELGLERIIRLAANENTNGCSPKVKEAIAENYNKIFLYPDGFCTELRSELSKLYNIEENKLIFGNGSFELLSLVAQAFINPGEESIIPEPSFGWYKVVTLAMNGSIVSLPLKSHSIDLDEVKDSITDRTKIIWLCNPNNPTGTFFNSEDLERFLREIPSRIVVVLDEAYYEFVTNDEYPNSINFVEKYPNIIILRTFSKVYGLASLRVGYGIAHPELIDLLNKIRLPINVNATAQVAALASLKDIDFKNACIKNNILGKEYYYKAFEELNLEYIPTETNFIMVNVERDSIEVVNDVLKRGISLRAGAEFGMPTWLRITIGRPDENQLVIEKLKEVLDIV